MRKRPDDGWLAEFKALCAELGVQTRSITNAAGQPDIAIDRDGLTKLIEAGLLPEDPSDLPAFMEALRRRRQDGGAA